LALRYPEIYWPVRLNCEAHGIEVKTIFHTENIWLRDYFPLQINGNFFRFQYKSNKRFPQLDVSNEPWTGVIAPIRELQQFIDGGNIVHFAGKMILTEKVTKDNGSVIISQLERIFDCEIIIIPVEPGDDLGHADGIVNFINQNNVLVNDYSAVAKKDKRLYAYEEALQTILESHNLVCHKIPNAYDEWNWRMTERDFRYLFPRADDFNPAFGYYINFLQVGDLIFLPAMKISRDKEAFEVVKKHFPEYTVIMVDCSGVAFEGGLVHCVSWNGVK
jgi:hypothetical protein